MKVGSPLPPPPVARPAASAAPPPLPAIDTGFVAVLSEDLESTVMHLCQHAKYLSQKQKEKLKAALMLVNPPPPAVVVQEVSYDASFDLAGEMASQIKAVRAIRAHVFDEHGNIKDGISSREAKEVISSGSTLLASLMKYHKDVMNMDRLRRLEQSVVDALMAIDQDLRDDVMQRLEERMELEEE